jgi:hypothetical protein
MEQWMASHMELGIEGLMFLALPWITPLLLIPRHLLKSSKMEQTEMLQIHFKFLKEFHYYTKLVISSQQSDWIVFIQFDQILQSHSNCAEG